MDQNRHRSRKARVFDFWYFWHDLFKFFGLIPGLIWLRPRRIYQSPEARKHIRGGAILAVNHIGFADPIYACYALWYRRQHFVATKELFRWRVTNRLFHMFRCIEIDRDNFGMDTFRDITDYLKEGRVVTIYPEGHINTAGEAAGMAAFKSGVVMMALRSRKPIVPLYVRPAAKWWQRTTFVFGDPIDICAEHGTVPSLDVIQEIAGSLRDREQELALLIPVKKGTKA